jgi:hypothetical protein
MSLDAKAGRGPVVLHARELGGSAYGTKQMTTVQVVGAVSSEAAEWYAINWQAIHRNVRRLQVRIAQAAMTGIISYVPLSRNRVSLEEAFEVLEPDA